jgi:hypothetical protein
MIPPYIDIILRVGRLLGTVRSLVVQTEQLVGIVNNYTEIETVLADGLDL